MELISKKGQSFASYFQYTELNLIREFASVSEFAAITTLNHVDTVKKRDFKDLSRP